MNGREFDTQKADLQFACVFQLVTPKDCSLSEYQGACDCQQGSLTRSGPLCTSTGGGPTLQIRGKAYPSVREMVIAHKMGAQGIVSSICPIHVVPANAANGDSPTDPLFGYRPAMTTLVNRIKASLATL